MKFDCLAVTVDASEMLDFLDRLVPEALIPTLLEKLAAQGKLELTDEFDLTFSGQLGGFVRNICRSFDRFS